MKFIEEAHLNNKKVVVRCDFNVPINNGEILDDSKIVRSLKTINYLIEKNCRVVLLSHLGRIKSEEDKDKNTLLPVRKRLEELLKMPVAFITDCINDEIPNDDRVILIENTRYYDYPEKRESSNDPELAKAFSKLGDIFIFDAFGTAHRRHASTSGIAKLLPTYIGYLVEEELENLSRIVEHNNPFVVVMGGAKVDDKLPIIKQLLPSCDNLLLGGGLANSFLKSMGFNIGKSLATDDDAILVELKCLIELYKGKILLPVDVVTENHSLVEIKDIDSIDNNDVIYDIGTKTVNKYENVIKNAETVFSNGTLGLYEDERFQNGTNRAFSAMKRVETVVIGGGDTVSAVNNLGYGDDFILSSGGGASLEYIANGSLPVLDDIK